ncbi:MAG TPA: DNA adenine methylase [Kofleriaceae bacterium]|nr:DNA adenine methylase [Kofleriaceae bacterium]
MANAAAPIVKWAGGKSKLVPALIARLPARWHRYFEPFAGGAALFFRLAPPRAVLGDVNADLIATYRALAADPDDVIRGLQRHVRAHGEPHYYDVRARWNDRTAWSAARTAAAFIYLNKTCFNGLWRVNRAGHFNVPMGRYARPTICEPAALHAAHAVLQRAELRAGDFRATLADAGRGDVCYLDPPYMPVSATASFTTYAATGFSFEHQQALAATARELVARGVHVILSNSDVPAVRALYKGFHIEEVRVARSINANAARRGAVNELIITGAR